FSHRKFVFGMKIIRIAGVDSDRQTGVGDAGSRERLRLARLCPCVVDRHWAAMAKRWKTHDVEREIALSKEPSPIGDRHGKDFAVLVSAIRVLFSLVPQRTCYRERRNGRQHSLVKHGRHHRPVLITNWQSMR